MTREGRPPTADGLAEFTEELKLLAETVLERVEPVLRHAAAEGAAEWASCSWCPVCAAAAVLRGEHHEVMAALAEHGTAIVTVLREALAGVPVEPVMPEGEPETDSEQAAPHRHSPTGSRRAAAANGDRPRPSYVGIPVTIKG
ncbi:hypothetical protein ACWEKT_14875 [Nocardia takedensis]|uniref:hypothetical protein n=1 Tax=Nocardia takedensis TaxID=259390 RepID=UPI0002E6EA79|nr:hypothetical protein [Nocardia takedensis]